ncbi:VanW like protein [Neomoorella glycerini]|uniref:VanW like protein n=1 Tax=Neomoorella glycerini TaxID=55779 RepID=A0A6I5ZMD6_9FIRM|nr:VanW family protein [Moorella glycerini]QGP90737.1 VanW like protein [Moorella glycerini]
MVRWKLAAFLIFMLGVAGLAVMGIYFSGRIFPGVTIAGWPVGGLPPAAARSKIMELAMAILDREIKLRLDDRLMTTSPRALGMKIDIEATLSRAWALGRAGNLQQRLSVFASQRRRLDLVYQWDQDRLQAELKHLGGDILKEPVDARLEIDNNGQPYLIPSQDGWQVDTESLLARLADSSPGQVIDIPLNRLEPRLTSAALAARKIEKPAGTFTTFFNPADTDRTHNIRLATRTLDGTWLPPGGEFSFNQVVGPRTIERGYREALVIEDRNFVPGIGGGVCQVSSTLYNAALAAGLTIVERQPHGLAIGYVPPGRDATVAYGLIDLKIRNDTPFWYWLKAGVDSDKLAMTFYAAGEAPAAEVVSQVIEKIPPPEEVEVVPYWPPERVEVKQEGKPGFRTRVIRIIHRQGKEGRQEVVSQDLYPPLPRVVRRGQPAEKVVPSPGS